MPVLVQRFVLPYIEMYLRWRVDQTYFNNNIAQIYKLISSERELRLKVCLLSVTYSLLLLINTIVTGI